MCIMVFHNSQKRRVSHRLPWYYVKKDKNVTLIKLSNYITDLLNRRCMDIEWCMYIVVVRLCRIGYPSFSREDETLTEVTSEIRHWINHKERQVHRRVGLIVIAIP